MTLHSIYSRQASRRECLTYFSQAIEKEQGRTLAFLTLDKRDHIVFIALGNISTSTINWDQIGKQKLRNCVQYLIHGPRWPNLLKLPPKEMIKAHLTPFLSGKDIANVQSTCKPASEVDDASHIIKTYHLAPLIAKYCHRYCDTLTEDEKIKILDQLMSLAKDVSELEELESPSYQSVRNFFELVEARNLIRMAAEMQEEHPLAGLQGAQLEIAADSKSTLQRAEQIREWFGQHQADLTAFNELNLSLCELSLLPPEIGQLRALTVLSLQNNCLNSLPKEIRELRALNRLWLDDNRLTSLPRQIGQLEALQELGLERNHLTRLPKEIGQLRALIGLDLEGNRLMSLPKEIGRLRALIRLGLGNNRLTSLPREIGRLRALTQFDLEGNRLSSLSKEIGQLRALTFLLLGNNRLTSLPKEIGRLKALTMLGLKDNCLTSLPKEIGRLRALTDLDLTNNRLRSLPKEIGRLRTLARLGLDDNRLTSLPKEIRQLEALSWLFLNNNRLTSLPKEIGQLGSLTRLWLGNNRLANLPKEMRQLEALNSLFLGGNGFIDLPAGLENHSTKLKGQNKAFQMQTILRRLKRCLSGKHDCKAIAVLLDKMEKFQGKEMRSKLHICIYEVCKNEKALRKKLSSSHFGRKALVDPAIDPKLKIAALDRFKCLFKVN